MGKLQPCYKSNTPLAMDIDPRPTSWNSLCPTFIDSRRSKIHLQDDTSGHVIGSPPPAGPPKITWDGKFPPEVPNLNTQEGSANTESPMDTSELSMRVQDITLQQPHPIIICENIDDVKVDISEAQAKNNVSLSVPLVDVANEKKRPPLSTPHN